MNEARNATSVICSAYDSFFEAEKKIADFLIEHKAEAAGMTVGELARASQTSDATVSRFCRRCGFKGFQDLKLALTRELLEEAHREQEVSNEIDRHDLDQSLKNILANKVAELTETVRMMDTDNLEAILQKLEHARLVQLAAVGNTLPVALDGAFKFSQLGITAVAETIWEAQTAYAFNLGPEDVVLIISNSGTFNRLQILAQGAKRKWCCGHSDHQQPGVSAGTDGRLPHHHGHPGKALYRGVLVFPCCGYGSHGNSVSSPDGRHADGSRSCAPA